MNGRRSALDLASPELRPYEMLGVRFNLLTRPTLLNIAQEAIESGEQWLVGGHNVHSVHLYHRDAKMRAFFDAARFIFLDGMPLVWLARWLHYPATRAHRHAPIDWMPLLLERAAERGWRVFFLGSTPRVEARAADVLRERFRGLELRTHHGYFDVTPGSAEGEEVLREITDWNPHILCVCMGMPRQEHWTVDHLSRLRANVIFDLGALMDLFAGELPIPPRWIGQVGFEWLFRLVSHPRRVWKRYLVEPWYLIPHLARDVRTHPRRAGNGTGDSGDHPE